MQLRIAPNNSDPIYLQIVNQIKYMAASGRLSPGEQLPPVRKLAEQLVVNPNTVARAYRELETAGLLTTRRGAGVYLSEMTRPLADKEKKKILATRIDALLAEARQLGIELEPVISLLRERNARVGEEKPS
jgi:DNA-binding transcriptional regulator YhcF (GntR family)